MTTPNCPTNDQTACEKSLEDQAYDLETKAATADTCRTDKNGDPFCPVLYDKNGCPIDLPDDFDWADTIVPPAPGWEILTGGSTARIELETGTTHVAKRLYPNAYVTSESCARELQREFDIYSVLPRHACLLHLLPGSRPDSLVFPYLRKGNLKDYLESTPDLPINRRLSLCADAAEALSVLHEHAVVHCDIQLTNLILSDDDRLCLIDFAGSKFRGEEGTVIESARYFLPRDVDAPATVRTDMFALGSLLYAIITGEPPYAEKTDDEVTDLFAKGIYPPMEGCPIEQVIRACWTGRYTDVIEACNAIKAVQTGYGLDAPHL